MSILQLKKEWRFFSMPHNAAALTLQCDRQFGHDTGHYQRENHDSL